MNFSGPFIRRPVATCLLMAAIALLGLAAFPRLPIAPLPQIDFPTILVTATLSGASAEIMSTSVAAPLERQLAQIAGVTEMTSFSALGATGVTVQFDLDRDIDAAAQDVQAAITAAGRTLPQAMTSPPTYRKFNPADAPILMLSVRSDSLPIIMVDEYADNFIAQQIAHVPGVAQVSIGGEQRPSIRVQVDPSKLAASGMTLEELRGAVVNATSNAAKGSINGAKASFTIVANDQITEAAEYNNQIIAYRDNGPVRVRDIGRAIAAATDRYSAAFDDNRPAILLNIYKQPGANIIDTVQRIRAVLPRLTANLPAAISLTTVLDRTGTIRSSVLDTGFTLVFTIILVVAVLLLFLRSKHAAAVSGATILLALLGAFAAMYVLNFSLDNLSLMALTIAIGFVVDDAIVVIENIHRHMEAGAPALDAALAGSRQVVFTVLSISISLVAVFIPLLFMGGIMGRLFREFALTITAAIGVSAFASLTLAPMLCARNLTATASEGQWFPALQRVYERTLDAALRNRAMTLGAFAGALVLTAYLATAIPKGFLPIEDTGMLQGLAEAGEAVSPGEMMRLQRQLGEILLRNPDIAGFASQTGSTGLAGNAQTANTARFFIALKPRSERDATAAQIIARLRPQLARIPGVTLALNATQDITLGGRASRGNFQYTLKDTNVAELAIWSARLIDRLRTVPEITDVLSDRFADAPQLRLVINRDRAAAFGISPDAIDQTLDDAFGQRQVTQYFTQLDTYWIVLEITPELQGSFATLDRIYVKSPLTGAAVPLSTLVSVATTPGPLSIAHDDQFPAVTISFNLQSGVALGQAITAIEDAANEIGMPATVAGVFTGNAQAFQGALPNEFMLIVAALAAVYIILGILYESFLHPLTILSTLPSAALGALIALRIAHIDLSLIGIAGILLLIGIVKKNGIMLVDFAIAAERERAMSPEAAIREACLLRFRPILMTTTAALLAGLPLALFSGTGSELRQPLGYAMVGGLALSQVLTLYTTPVVYLYLDRLRSRLRSRSTDVESEPSRTTSSGPPESQNSKEQCAAVDESTACDNS
ncbi:MAG TPA: efflux RND transporter permease subunit [Micropepsaceae bacterium]|nr:efflux RND transporter permease subunit [Micropepsaceae bacterium]